jgi:hypothetical protein
MHNDAYVRYEGTILSTLALYVIFITNVIELIVMGFETEPFQRIRIPIRTLIRVKMEHV